MFIEFFLLFLLSLCVIYTMWFGVRLLKLFEKYVNNVSAVRQTTGNFKAKIEPEYQSQVADKPKLIQAKTPEIIPTSLRKAPKPQGFGSTANPDQTDNKDTNKQ